jgi:hypothetical protein
MMSVLIQGAVSERDTKIEQFLSSHQTKIDRLNAEHVTQTREAEKKLSARQVD